MSLFKETLHLIISFYYRGFSIQRSLATLLYYSGTQHVDLINWAFNSWLKIIPIGNLIYKTKKAESLEQIDTQQQFERIQASYVLVEG